jgi:hypothetical protein
MDGSAPPRMTAEQRRRIEEEEERREAERAAELARQRALLQEVDEDRYVSRRMDRERATIAELNRQAEDETRAALGDRPGPGPYRLLLIGAALSAALLGLITWLGNH